MEKGKVFFIPDPEVYKDPTKEKTEWFVCPDCDVSAYVDPEKIYLVDEKTNTLVCHSCWEKRTEVTHFKCTGCRSWQLHSEANVITFGVPGKYCGPCYKKTDVNLECGCVQNSGKLTTECEKHSSANHKALEFLPKIGKGVPYIMDTNVTYDRNGTIWTTVKYINENDPRSYTYRGHVTSTTYDHTDWASAPNYRKIY